MFCGCFLIHKKHNACLGQFVYFSRSQDCQGQSQCECHRFSFIILWTFTFNVSFFSLPYGTFITKGSSLIDDWCTGTFSRLLLNLGSLAQRSRSYRLIRRSLFFSMLGTIYQKTHACTVYHWLICLFVE